MTKTKTLVATGASSGLGFEAVKQLLLESPPDTSYRLIIGARDTSSARAAYDAATNIDSRHTTQFLDLQLAELTSVKTFAERILEEMGSEQLDTLLLCAGIVKAASGERFAGDMSEAYAVNHLSQHYLVHLLEDKIRASSTRAVFVSSRQVHQVKDPTKYVQLLSALHWHRTLGKQARVIAVSPGFVPASNLSRESGLLGRWAMYYLVSLLPAATSIHDGGKAIVHAVDSEQILADERQIFLNNKGEVEQLDGAFFDEALQNKWCPTLEEIEKLRMTGVADVSSSPIRRV